MQLVTFLDENELRVLADLVLALVLFSDAASVNKVVLESGLSLPLRMLLIGLPGVIAAGFLAAWLMFDSLTLWEMAILATMLSATDAALGKTVVTSKAVPANIRMALNVESGLNDGICVPILFLFIALATADAGSHDTTALAVQLVVTEIGIGLFAGLSVTAVGIWFIFHAWRRGWITDLWGLAACYHAGPDLLRCRAVASWQRLYCRFCGRIAVWLYSQKKGA